MKIVTIIASIFSLFVNLAFGSSDNPNRDTLFRNNLIQENSVDEIYQVSYKKLIIPAIGIGYGVLSLTDDRLKELNNSTRFEIGEHSPSRIKADNYTQFIPGALVYGLNAFGLEGKHGFKDRSIILATSLLISTAIVTPTKQLVKEQRPDGSNNLSFPSGHTATAFATAHFMFREYRGNNLWLSLLGYPFAIFTGTYRTFNDKHWVGDVVAGAGIGILSTEIAYWSFPPVSKLLGRNMGKKTVILPYYQSNKAGFNCFLTF
ncbi:phosphatase PAP2 family protein [Sphingobacterium sp. DR205]|uniref:phosphatase PAP2 family protein n=1 Tax=Sphingobacterium sp. DR205 TaxID=2713573 RepID=UPI0013E45990|nr:phosphatase PAP2 family protein [Sphingobacterium sp. DR205]QIH34068.1 phosphatase PAP2 family protein [Sphingobacterium sp. DR205]